jgi:hypothetical protein
MSFMSHMSRRFFLPAPGLVFLLGFALAVTSPASAAEHCPVPYSEFEENIPHIDMLACPKHSPNEDTGFCRLVMEGEKVFVYSFHYTDEEPCLVAIEKAKKATYLMQE